MPPFHGLRRIRDWFADAAVASIAVSLGACGPKESAAERFAKGVHDRMAAVCTQFSWQGKTHEVYRDISNGSNVAAKAIGFRAGSDTGPKPQMSELSSWEYLPIPSAI